jgi:hypothetical protein
MEYPRELTYHHVQGNTITKTHIYETLNVGETWLRQAVEGYQLVRLYGESGACEAHEVTDEIAKRCEPPLGSGKLLEFLRSWEASHPA